jgi:hypothetical protein
MSRVKVEIYEGDPFSDGCCGPGIGSVQAAMKLRKMLSEREDIVTRLRGEFKENLEITREIVSARKSLDNYPTYAKEFISAGASLPFILVNETLAVKGRFPSFEELRQLITEHLK